MTIDKTLIAKKKKFKKPWTLAPQLYNQHFGFETKIVNIRIGIQFSFLKILQKWIFPKNIGRNLWSTLWKIPLINLSVIGSLHL